MTLATDIANYLGLTEWYVHNVAAKAQHAYFRFTVPKRAGGLREIFHPSKRLKAIQRGINRLIIANWPVHAAAMAYRPATNILDNAKQHAESNYLLRVDVRNFFPSITEVDVDSFLRHVQPDWTSADRSMFVRLVCLHGRLTIGAPSSPSLSNAMCYKLDSKLSQLADSLDLVAYTRYADDLFFSCNTPGVLAGVPGQVAEILSALDVPGHLELNPAKIRHSSRAGRRRVTGLVLGSDKRVRVDRQLKRKVRSLVYQLESLDSTQRDRLAGTLAYIRDTEPDFLNRLYVKYGASKVSKALRGSGA